MKQNWSGSCYWSLKSEGGLTSLETLGGRGGAAKCARSGSCPQLSAEPGNIKEKMDLHLQQQKVRIKLLNSSNECLLS